MRGRSDVHRSSLRRLQDRCAWPVSTRCPTSPRTPVRTQARHDARVSCAPNLSPRGPRPGTTSRPHLGSRGSPVVRLERARAADGWEPMTFHVKRRGRMDGSTAARPATAVVHISSTCPRVRFLAPRPGTWRRRVRCVYSIGAGGIQEWPSAIDGKAGSRSVLVAKPSRLTQDG